MKLLRKAVVAVAIIGMVAVFSKASFAEGGKSACKTCKEGEEANIKLLQDSAVAMQKTNPTLASGLSDWANEEAKEMQEWKEHKAKHEAKKKLLTDSAVALEKTNPDLAKGLKEMAEKKHGNKKHEMMEKNEKEEAGEMVESKEEQSENKQ